MTCDIASRKERKEEVGGMESGKKMVQWDVLCEEDVGFGEWDSGLTEECGHATFFYWINGIFWGGIVI